MTNELRRRVICKSLDKSIMLLDARFNSSTMYDAASKSIISLDSAGTFNTTYSCLQKKANSGNYYRGAAKMNLSNSLLRTFDINKFTENSQCMICTYFKPILSDPNSFWTGVGFAFDSGSTSWNFGLGTARATLKPYVQYGTDTTYKLVYHQFGRTARVAELWLENQLLVSNRVTGNITMFNDIISRSKSSTNLVFLPSPFSDQQYYAYYIERMTISVIL